MAWDFSAVSRVSPPCAQAWHWAVGFVFFALVVSVAAAPNFDRLLVLAQQRYGISGAQAVQQWRTLMRELGGATDAEKIERINAFFNRKIAFKDDAEVWGAPDYWATPLETLGKGAGDCEDFAIAKYISLKLLDVPVDKMRLIYVRAQIGGPHSSLTQAHMVVGYYETPGADPLILDNLVTAIYPAVRRPDLFPVFSFNSDGLWVGPASGNPTASATARLSRWRDVISRMQAEGVQ